MVLSLPSPHRSALIFWDLIKKAHITEKTRTGFDILFILPSQLFSFVSILIFRSLNDTAVIDKLFTIAGYTYGPLLGMFSFGLFTNRQVKDRITPVVAILSPLVCYIIGANSQEWFNGYKFGFEMLLVNGFLTFMGLLAFSKPYKNLH